MGSHGSIWDHVHTCIYRHIYEYIHRYLYTSVRCFGDSGCTNVHRAHPLCSESFENTGFRVESGDYRSSVWRPVQIRGAEWNAFFLHFYCIGCLTRVKRAHDTIREGTACIAKRKSKTVHVVLAGRQ